jgi:hypothetical protein
LVQTNLQWWPVSRLEQVGQSWQWWSMGCASCKAQAAPEDEFSTAKSALKAWGRCGSMPDRLAWIKGNLPRESWQAPEA